MRTKFLLAFSLILISVGCKAKWLNRSEIPHVQNPFAKCQVHLDQGIYTYDYEVGVGGETSAPIGIIWLDIYRSPSTIELADTGLGLRSNKAKVSYSKPFSEDYAKIKKMGYTKIMVPVGTDVPEGWVGELGFHGLSFVSANKGELAPGQIVE